MARSSPGNNAGGLANVLEKSLGGAKKGGNSPLMEVYKYAEPVTAKGLVIMDTPGYDPASATGQIAGGANMVCFTTGRGSCFGSVPAPTMKLASNTPMYTRNAGGHGRQLRGDHRWRGDDRRDRGSASSSSFCGMPRAKRPRASSAAWAENEFVPWPIGVLS